MAKVYSLRDMKRETAYTTYKKGKVQDVLTDNIQPPDKEAEDVTDEDAANDYWFDCTESDPGLPGDDTEEDGDILRTGMLLRRN